MRNRFLSLRGTCWLHLKNILSISSYTKKTLTFSFTDGKEEAQHHWPSRSTQISNRAKCSPVCPFENDNCCMARLLSKQEDFTNQVSILETIIQEAGHECIFLPKFHCELNPIEMVSSESFQVCFYEVN